MEKRWDTGGTVLVKDIIPADISGWPENLINVNGTLFFTALVKFHGRELWKSDGTPAGTVALSDVVASNSSSRPACLTDVNGIVFFDFSDVPQASELWKSNGTPEGTVMIKRFSPGSNQSLTLSPNIFEPPNVCGGINLNGTLLFVTNDGTHGFELWKSDGTPGGTVLVKDIDPGGSSSFPGSMVSWNGIVYFFAGGPTGQDLWRSDGTTNGTLKVKDLNPSLAILGNLILVNNSLFFTSINEAQEYKLWKSDGTDDGTVPFPGSLGPSLLTVTPANGQLFFDGRDEIHGHELWSLISVVLDKAVYFPTILKD